MSVKDNFQQTETKMKKAIESAMREFNEVRTGRAHPGLVEGLHIDYCGTKTLVKQIAAINVPDPKTIIIQPWDPAALVEIEKALNASNIGGSVYQDGKVIKLSIPPLSTERREEMKKAVKDMAEKSRVSLRTIRRESNDKIKKFENDKLIAKDESFKAQEQVQKLTDKFIAEIDKLLEEKNKALTF